MNLLLENKQYHDLCPVDFGFDRCEPGHSFGPHRREYYLIHCVMSGTGIFKNERAIYNIRKNQAFLIRPGEICKYTADKINPWYYVWIGFTGQLAADFDEIADVFEADCLLFEEMKTAADSDCDKEAFLTGMLFKLYSDLFRSRKKPNYTNKVIEFINANYMNDICISDIADSLCLNRKYLSRLFKQQTGTTMQRFLLEKRMTEAVKLLYDGYSVKETSQMAGYSDMFAFSKIFKQRFGISPVHYKKVKQTGDEQE